MYLDYQLYNYRINLQVQNKKLFSPSKPAIKGFHKQGCLIKHKLRFSTNRYIGKNSEIKYNIEFVKKETVGQSALQGIGWLVMSVLMVMTID